MAKYKSLLKALAKPFTSKSSKGKCDSFNSCLFICIESPELSDVIKRSERGGLGENCCSRTEAIPFRDPGCSHEQFPPHSEAWGRGFWSGIQGNKNGGLN